MKKKDAICTVLKIIRIHRNLTQERIRNDINLDVSKYETGSFCPSLVSYITLCKYLRVHPGDVIDWAELLEREKIKQNQIHILLTG